MNIQNEGLLYFLWLQGSEEQNLIAGFPTEEIPVELPGMDRGGWS